MPNKDETARFLADAHFRLDEGIVRIFRVLENNEDSHLRPVKLLEISSVTPEMGISPVGMSADPSRGVFYPSVVIEITASEFDRLQSGELKLPHDWTLGDELAAPVSTKAMAS